MEFSFRFWWFCNSKHTEGVPVAQFFSHGNLHRYMDSAQHALTGFSACSDRTE